MIAEGREGSLDIGPSTEAEIETRTVHARSSIRAVYQSGAAIN